MSFKIVSDSASNILRLPGVNYACVPLKIITDQAEYVDDENLDVTQMVSDLRQYKGRSGTSCPNVQEWVSAFGDARFIVAIAITSNLSGSCNAAFQAKQQYEQEHPGAKVLVVDSLSAGPEMALLIEKAKELILQKLPIEQIGEKLEAYRQKTHLLFSLESLNNLARNGRVNPAVAKIAGVLGIRAVGRASDVGTLEQLHKCRGERKALETIFAEMLSRGYQGGKVRIAHCLNSPAATKLKESILSVFPKSDIHIEPTTALCSFYAEQGGLMIGFESI
jgi:DegV family protein with EDD domain